jgi:hypothetical protein
MTQTEYTINQRSSVFCFEVQTEVCRVARGSRLENITTMVIAECCCKHFPEAGLAPATYRLEVCRATIAPHGTIPCIFRGEKVTKFTLNLILTKTQKCPTFKLMKASACLCLNQDTNMHSPCLCLKQDTSMHSPSST